MTCQAPIRYVCIVNECNLNYFEICIDMKVVQVASLMLSEQLMTDFEWFVKIFASWVNYKTLSTKIHTGWLKVNDIK